MGTRHLIVVKKDKKNKIAQYGQWDGYLKGQGSNILEFLKETGNIEKLKNSLSKVRFIDKNRDKDFLEEYNKNSPQWSNEPDNRTKEQKRWFETYITRDLGSNILSNVANSEDKEIILEDESEFAKDTLFCEYAYVIDFDKNTFEVYKCGFERVLGKYDLNKLPTEKELFKLDKNDEDESEN